MLHNHIKRIKSISNIIQTISKANKIYSPPPPLPHDTDLPPISPVFPVAPDDRGAPGKPVEPRDLVKDIQDMTEEERIAELGRPRLGETIKIACHIRESMEFKVGCLLGASFRFNGILKIVF